MKAISRRKAMVNIAGGGASLALMNLNSSTLASGKVLLESKEERSSTIQTIAARAFRGQHQPQPLPFDPAKLRGISEKLIRSHWENNYGGAVKALNAVEQRIGAMLRERDLPAYVYGDLKREELVRSRGRADRSCKDNALAVRWVKLEFLQRKCAQVGSPMAG